MINGGCQTKNGLLVLIKTACAGSRRKKLNSLIVIINSVVAAYNEWNYIVYSSMCNVDLRLVKYLNLIKFAHRTPLDSIHLSEHFNEIFKINNDL